jgi:hypothetical protein
MPLTGILISDHEQSFHEFRNFVQRITTGLKGKNVLPYLGKPYRELLEAAIEAVEVSQVRLMICVRIIVDHRSSRARHLTRRKSRSCAPSSAPQHHVSLARLILTTSMCKADDRVADMQGENATTIRILKRGLDAANGS